MRIALDHDSTLASTGDVAFDLICGPDHEYTAADIESWTWGFDEFGKDAYLNGLWHAWTLRPLDVPPLEEDLAGTVDALRDEHEVDIVTAHPDQLGIENGKKAWLDHHGIGYDEFRVVPTDQSKATLDYDVYVDDKPTLPGKVAEHNPEATVYVRDQAYNQGINDPHVRVGSVAEAAAYILPGRHPSTSTHDHTVNVTK